MDSEREERALVRMYCPNCGAKVSGYRSEDGSLRLSCPRCRVGLFSKQHGRREIDIKMRKTL